MYKQIDNLKRNFCWMKTWFSFSFLCLSLLFISFSRFNAFCAKHSLLSTFSMPLFIYLFILADLKIRINCHQDIHYYTIIFLY